MAENQNTTGQEGAGENIASVESMEGLTQEQLAAQFNAAAEEGSEGKGGKEGTEGGEGTGNEGGGGGGEFKSSLSEEETSMYGEILGSDIPEEVFKDDKGEALSKKEVIKRISNMIEKKSQSKLLNDPFISKYIAEKSKEGFNQADFVKGLISQTDVMKMGSREFLENYLKNNNYSEDDIKGFFEGKNIVDIDELAKAKKQEVLREQENKNTKAYKEFIQRRTQELEVFNGKVGTLIDNYVDNNLKTGKHPLKLAESDMEKVATRMRELTQMQLVEVDGRQYEATKLDSLLKDNSKLLNVLPYIALEDLGMLDSSMRETLNEVKNREFEKIDGTSALGTGGKPGQGTNWAKFKGNS